MHQIWTRLDRELRHLLVYGLAVLGLTLFARGFAGAAQAQITLAAPQSRTMTGEFVTVGTLTPLGTAEHPIPDGLVVEESAEIGTELEAGDPVVLVDPEALEELLTRRRAEVTQLELRIEALLDHEDPSEDAVSAARAAVSDAKDLRDDRETALAAAQEALELADETQLPAAEAAVVEAEQLLEDTEEALSAARAQLKREEAALAQAQTQARREQEANEAEASVLQLDLDKAAGALAELEAVRDAGYAVTAPGDGILAGLEENSFSMTNPYGGNLLTFRLDGEDAAFLTPAKGITISREEQSANLSGCTAEATDEEGTTFTAPMTKPGWESGSVIVSGVLWEEQYDICVPIGALRRDSAGYFLFVLERRSSLWGIEQTVRKVYVQPERQDGAYAAVSGLEPGCQVVVTSSKPLTEGSRVRVMP